MTSSFWEPLYTGSGSASLSAPPSQGVRRLSWQEQTSAQKEALAHSSDILTYRGHRYRLSTYLMEGIELQADTVYRGVRHRLRAFFATSTTPAQPLSLDVSTDASTVSSEREGVMGDRSRPVLVYRGVPYVR